MKQICYGFGYVYVGSKWVDQDLNKNGAKVSQYRTNLLWFLVGVRGFENGLIGIWTEKLPK